ncbi:hypothetical protein VTN49DRAFT_4546 [Thermomyces lanuginosus]|uniref:uncharacterized protein n=1 Tax=Thermomyces lanuginosus TaxID=5541 RepID=UPI003742CE07
MPWPPVVVDQMPYRHSLVHEVEVTPQRRMRRSAIVEPHHRRAAGAVVRVQSELHSTFRWGRGPDDAQRLLAAAALNFLRLRHDGGLVGSTRPGRRLSAGSGLGLEMDWRSHAERGGRSLTGGENACVNVLKERPDRRNVDRHGFDGMFGQFGTDGC